MYSFEEVLCIVNGIMPTLLKYPIMYLNAPLLPYDSVPYNTIFLNIYFINVNWSLTFME